MPVRLLGPASTHLLLADRPVDSQPIHIFNPGASGQVHLQDEHRTGAFNVYTFADAPIRDQPGSLHVTLPMGLHLAVARHVWDVTAQDFVEEVGGAYQSRW